MVFPTSARVILDHKTQDVEVLLFVELEDEGLSAGKSPLLSIFTISFSGFPPLTDKVIYDRNNRLVTNSTSKTCQALEIS